MRILNKFSLALALVTVSIICEAQKNKELKGYIISLQNDTLPCSFKQKNWKKQPVEIIIIFNGKDSSISSENVNSFSVTSIQLEFVSRTIRLTNYVEKFQDATTSKVPELSDPQKSFLKTLYKGSFSLYLYMDKLNRKHFFIEGPNNLVELYSHYYISLPPPLSNSIPITVLDKSYEFVLKTLMTPCRSLFGIIENITLDEDQLIQVFKLYDKCLEPKKED